MRRRWGGKVKTSGRADRKVSNCFGNVKRRSEDRLPKIVYKSKLEGRRN